MADDKEGKKPSFMDLFAVHLASRLIGREKLLKFFDSVPSSKPSNKPLRVCYWKSPLLLTGDNLDTCTSDSSGTSNGDDWHMVFLDITVTFDVSKQELTTTVGMMLVRKEECVYVTSPLSFSQLATHSEKIGIDIVCTYPNAIAHAVGGAFMGMAWNTTLTLQRSDGTNISTAQDFVASEKLRLPLSLHYRDLQETGTLELKTDTADTFNSKSRSMMMENLRRVDELEPKKDVQAIIVSVHDPQAAADLTKSFESWLDALKRIAEGTAHAYVKSAIESKVQGKAIEEVAQKSGKENVASRRVDSSNAPIYKHTAATIHTESTSSIATLEPVDAKAAPPEKKKEEEPNKQQSQPPAKRPQEGYVRVSNPKRKRRGKLTFAKASI